MQSSKNRFDEDKYKCKFKKRFRELTAERETVKSLASFLGCTETAIGQYKEGNTFPKTENLIKIAEYFQCSLDYLIGLSDIRTPNTNVKYICEETGLCEESIQNLRELVCEYDSFTLDATNHLLSTYFDYWRELSVDLARAFHCAIVEREQPVDEDGFPNDIKPFIVSSDIEPFLMSSLGSSGVVGFENGETIHLTPGYIRLKAKDAKSFYIQKANRKFLQFLEDDVSSIEKCHTEMEGE